MHTNVKYLATTLILLATMTLSAGAVMATTTTSPPTPAAATSKHAVVTAEQQQIQQADALAQNGRKAMSYITAAHKLLSEKHNDEAHQYLEQAKALLLKLKAEVSAGNKNASDSLPIYSQLGVKEGVEITDQLKQQIGKTHLDAARGNHEKVVAVLKTTDIELQYSFVDLPVTATLGKVEAALKSLSAKDTKQASQTLAAAQQGLIHDSIVINAASENSAG